MLIWQVLVGVCGMLVQHKMGVLVGTHGGWVRHWVPGVLIQHEMAHHSAKGGTWVLVDAHGVLVGACGVLVWHVMVHCSARGRSFGQGEGGGEVSDKDERENAVEPLNKLSCVQGVHTSCQMQPFSMQQGT